MAIRDAALAALTAEQAARDQARAEATEAMVSEARATWDGTMTAPDGKLPVAGKDLTVAYTDLDGGLTVLTDGVTSVGVKDGTVALVVDDGGWVRKAGPLTSLADLGRALA
jgi:folate-dependent tRNA-U54 methylase TrmFO/GidA